MYPGCTCMCIVRSFAFVFPIQNSKDVWKRWRDLDSFCSFLGRLFAHDVLTLDTLLSCIRALVEDDTEASWLSISKILKDLVAHPESHRMVRKMFLLLLSFFVPTELKVIPAGSSQEVIKLNILPCCF